jgi:membrane-bound lytic murein transglycosylase B
MRKINLTVFTEYSIAGMFTVIFLIPTVAFGTSVSFDEWLESFRQEARAEKISNATIESAFKNLKQNKRVLELDQKQPEFGLTSLQYLKRLVSVKKVLNGAKRLKQNQSLLLEVEKKYNVQPRFVVALWGIETDYGRLTGGFSVIEALVTLAYDGRRSAFFRTELMNALHP